MAASPAIRRRPGEQGFSLIELSVALMVVAVLASFGIANFMQFNGRAHAAACILKQRRIVEAVLILVGEQTPRTNLINSKYLLEAELIRAETAECPRSGDNNYTDYQVTLNGSEIESIECLVRMEEHAYRLH